MQGGFARFFYTLGYRSTDALAHYVSRQLSNIMGVQRGGAKEVDSGTTASGFSPSVRAKKVIDTLRLQVMNLSAGNIVEFQQLMQGDVSLYLLKFELFIKNQQKDGTSRS